MIFVDNGHQHHRGRAIGQGNEQNRPFSSCAGLFRGAGADQEAHQQSEIVAGDMEQIALVDVLSTAKPGLAYATAVEDVGERVFDDFGAQLERRLGHPR